jgi:hypothetical protein
MTTAANRQNEFTSTFLIDMVNTRKTFLHADRTSPVMENGESLERYLAVRETHFVHVNRRQFILSIGTVRRNSDAMWHC